MSPLDRRAFLRLCGAGGTLWAAGCDGDVAAVDLADHGSAGGGDVVGSVSGAARHDGGAARHDGDPRDDGAGDDGGTYEGYPDRAAPALDATACPDPFAGGRFVEILPFLGEGAARLEEKFGAGHDARRYTDLGRLERDALVIPTARFYLRTEAPDLADLDAPWSIDVSGLVTATTLDPVDLAARATDQGELLIECSGNSRGAAYGLMSACTWRGVPVTELLDELDIDPAATRLLVRGFDERTQRSTHSRPGASWVFTFDELASAGAFLATHMNGAPLPHDHGFPVRLMVPGWYGCACIKWVDALQLVDDEEPATAQMREFASRTHQRGVPDLARDYRPAAMHRAAMPVRLERWAVDGAPLIHVVGIVWGGSGPAEALEIRFGDDAPWAPVDLCPAPTNGRTWTLWSHAWRPTAAGSHTIRLRVADDRVPQQRLDIGYYDRSVLIDFL